ncbi:MAG: hypothetical protein FJ011_19225 [Chloroflexi bacterium]|nr:hypothetical protein [Chloroflexota bacterium]
MSLLDFFRQLSHLGGLPAALLAGAAAATIVIVRDWRLALFAYAVQTTMLAMLLAQALPVEWALLQAIAGGLVAVMLYLSARQLHVSGQAGLSWEARWPQMASTSGFRLLAVMLAGVAFLSVHESVALPRVSPLFRDAILWLMLLGLLGLALHDEPFHAGLSLLTVLGGFSLLWFSLVQRRMLIGLADAGQVLLGLAISYLVVSQGLAGQQAKQPGEISE